MVDNSRILHRPLDRTDYLGVKNQPQRLNVNPKIFQDDLYPLARFKYPVFISV